MRIFILGAAFLSFLGVPGTSANVVSFAEGSQTKSCFNPSALLGLCTRVYDNAKASQPSQHRYEFERMMFEGACVGDRPANDPDALSAIRQMWRDNPEKFTCSSSDFDVSEGSILKYSISSTSYSFFNAALDRWELDLNKVDRSDGRTILDYLEEQLRRSKGYQGSNREQELKRFIRRVRERGGLTASEVRALQQ